MMIEERSVGDLRSALDSGEVSSRQLAEACLQRIRDMDQRGPALHAVIETNPDALAIADEMDAELDDGRSRGLLHGIPILLKDSIATHDQMTTAAGSLALDGCRATRDAFIVQRLRAAGAVIVGSSNLSEWSNFRSGASSSGWSARGGQARNPYQLDRTPSGSSSGGAVAVAASYVPLAIGTETNGSICSPAGTCGIVGIKPTVGLVSRSGIIPISHRQDTAGPMARSVTDAAILLNAIAGDDADDPAQRPGEAFAGYTWTPRPDGFATRDYTSVLDADGLRGMRIGIWRTPLENHDGAQRVFESALCTLREAGATLVDPVGFPCEEELAGTQALWRTMVWELKAGVEQYLRDYTGPECPMRTLADIVRFNNDHADEELLWFGQSLLEAALETGTLDDPAYREQLDTVVRLGRDQGIDAAITEHRLDAIVALANGPATRIALVNGDHRTGGSSTPSAIAGYPIVTVPAGDVFGLPVGVNFLGTAWSEETLIRAAFAFEQAAQARIRPTYAPAGIFPPGTSERPSPITSAR